MSLDDPLAARHPADNRRWLLALLLLALLLRLYRLDFPERKMFDEVYYVPAACDYLDSRPDHNNVHPPLAKVHIAAGILLLDGLKAYGCNPFPDAVAWRIASLGAGMGTLLAAYSLALSLTGKPRVALFTVGLLSIDFLQLVQSRIAMLDEIQCFWITLAFALLAHASRGQGSRWKWVWLAGLSFGCATACKWNGLFAAAGGALGWLLLGPERPDARRVARLSLIFAFTIALVYVASYTPLFLREGNFGSQAFGEIWGYHKRMWSFRFDPNQFHHRYLSWFWQWPLVLRPVWYFYESRDSLVRGVVALGNPVFWWFALMLLGDLLVSSWKRCDRAGQFLLVAYLAQWLLWATSTTGGFFYYMLPMTPLMAVVVARELADWWEEGLSRRMAALYMGVLVLVFALYYPLLTGLPVAERYFRLLFFYSGWV